MQKKVIILGVLIVSSLISSYMLRSENLEKGKVQQKDIYWFLLLRASNREYLYKGIAGDVQKSVLIREFLVKTGVPGWRPTPLPRLMGRAYWTVTGKRATANPETAPYFLTLDIPFSDSPPFGPVPYEECNGQCDWERPGAFGLHGVNGDETKLLDEDPGSSGCIRHSDEAITYLYTLLDPEREEIRYYIEDR